MTKSPPDRLTISFPEDSDVDPDTIDELVEDSDCQSRSEYIRKLLADETADDVS